MLFFVTLFSETGMVDIARQTVEFLYEENGGIPRDLYLPTIEDIKDEANKFTIDKVRKGTKILWRKRRKKKTLNVVNICSRIHSCNQSSPISSWTHPPTVGLICICMCCHLRDPHHDVFLTQV